MNTAIWYIRRKFGAPAIETDKAKEILFDSTDNKVLLIDCRRPDEYEVSRIPGAINLHFRCSDEDLVEALKTATSDNVTAVVSYCSLGYRSAIMTNRIRESLQKEEKGDFSLKPDQVFNLEGSIFKWANEDKPLVDNEGNPTKYEQYVQLVSAVNLRPMILSKQSSKTP